jgi:predicted acetyltransferase
VFRWLSTISYVGRLDPPAKLGERTPAMSAQLETRRLDADRDLEALSQIEGWAFGFAPAEAPKWLARAGLENVRVAVSGRDVVGGAVLLPMGQWFGGQSVPMMGIAGVAVAPHARGRGVAATLMRAVLAEIAQRRVALSTLFASTQTLYRSVGYELAGSRYRVTLQTAQADSMPRELDVRAIGEADRAAVRELYAQHAREHDGHLDRGDYIWHRVETARDKSVMSYLVEHDGTPEGYAYLTVQPTAGDRQEIFVKDAVALTAGAARRLLRLLADHRALADRAVAFGGPVHPFFALLPEASYELALAHHFMTRIVDARAALEARGYPRALQVELVLDLDDPLLHENRERWLVQVAGGRAEVRQARAGASGLKLGVRALAALFSGFATARSLARLDLARGTPAQLDAAEALFSGPLPCMPDAY